MSSTRRHASLIPLSREHHYSLVVCLRIHRGLGKDPLECSWLRERAELTLRFFYGDLKIHFETEEDVLFPAMQGMPGAGSLIRELLEDHREIERLIRELQRTRDALLSNPLARFADLMEAHIRREERLLFPIYEQHATAGVSEQIRWEIEARIGLALQPRHPELLK